MSVVRRRLLRVGVLGAVAVGGSALWVLMDDLQHDPNAIVLPDRVGQALPRFALPGLDGAGFSSDEARQPVVLNVFASWCVPCARETPELLALRDAGVAIWGIAYKDKPEATQAFLAAKGNPYQRIGRDDDGAVGAALGLMGVPTTYLVDGHGVIRWQNNGGLSRRDANAALLPAWRQLISAS